MTTLQIADQTFVAAPAATVAEFVANPQRWRAWWPDLDLEVREDRGPKGIRWRVRGALDGTMEIWLDPALDGVVLNYFLHAEPLKPVRGRKVLALNSVRRIAGKTMAFEVKEVLEQGRIWGRPVSPDAQSTLSVKEN